MNFGTNAGHTLKGPGSGAVGILNESKETRAVVKELNALLKAGGHNVVDCTIDSASSQNAYLQKAVEYANRQDLDYFISIHFNKYKGAKGVEVYTYEGRQFTDALEVCKNIAALGFVNRGVENGTGLYVIRKTKAKSMLIEVCFVDDPDASKYKQLGAKKIAEAIYKAIVDTNVPTVSTPKPDTSKPVTKPKGYDQWVCDLQKELNRQGYKDSKGKQLVTDGLNGEKTLSACPTLKKGAKGNITLLVQKRLNSVGFNINTDGNFGKNTEKAIITFQKNRGLDDDGIVGKNTWKYLLSGKKY